jgi:hypothetical protein
MEYQLFDPEEALTEEQRFLMIAYVLEGNKADLEEVMISERKYFALIFFHRPDYGFLLRISDLEKLDMEGLIDLQRIH